MLLHITQRLHILLLAVAAMAFCSACEEDETSLGLGLQTSDSQFVGIHDTIEAPDLVASTCFDDSLRTSGYYTTMVGHYSDALYGAVDARSFIQLALSNNSGLDFERDNLTVDSAILSLAIVDRYPVMTADKQIHLRLWQTSEKVEPDTIYYSTDAVGISSVLLLDTTVTVTPTDSVVRLSMAPAFRNLFSGHSFASTADLQESFKGLCIEGVAADSDPLMLTFDLAQKRSGLTLYYLPLSTSGESHTEQVSLLVGYTSPQSEATHFSQFTHTYSGDFLQLQQHAIDSIDGSQKLYLEPLGGTMIQVKVDSYVRRFRAAHPRAVIHYAELLLPVSSDADDAKPERIVAYRRYDTGRTIFINDYLSNYRGYDGYYDADKKQYRIRITQHLQGLMLDGNDAGTLLMIDGRRSSACRTILNGTQTSNPIRIALIYSE